MYEVQLATGPTLLYLLSPRPQMGDPDRTRWETLHSDPARSPVSINSLAFSFGGIA